MSGLLAEVCLTPLGATKLISARLFQVVSCSKEAQDLNLHLGSFPASAAGISSPHLAVGKRASPQPRSTQRPLLIQRARGQRLNSQTSAACRGLTPPPTPPKSSTAGSNPDTMIFDTRLQCDIITSSQRLRTINPTSGMGFPLLRDFPVLPGRPAATRFPVRHPQPPGPTWKLKAVARQPGGNNSSFPLTRC